MPFRAINPATGELLAEHPTLSAERVQTLLDRACSAQRAWGGLPVEERVRPLVRLGEILLDRATELGRLATLEMGKPIRESAAEVEKCQTACAYYASEASRHLEARPVEIEGGRAYWIPRPLGVVLGIMPWNFPFWQAVRFAVPAVTAGNAVLLKHAPSVPGCAESLERLFADAGYPEGIFTNLRIDIEEVGRLIDDPRVRGVSLTGSVSAGREVGGRAGRAIKPCVLELGGSDPSLVLDDAYLDQAVASCVRGRLQNSGQSCIAAKRFVVVEAVADAFESRLVERVRSVVVGDPMDPATEMGPLARIDLRDTLHDQVERSIAGGARVVVGGTVPDRPGAWYPPTVLVDVGPGTPAYEEELFGPVAALIRAEDEADAIRIANDTAFGLGAVVYTGDTARGERIARDHLDAGLCFVNGIVRSDPGLPFGGTKRSGIGRELAGPGMLEFTNLKTVWIDG